MVGSRVKPSVPDDGCLAFRRGRAALRSAARQSPDRQRDGGRSDIDSTGASERHRSDGRGNEAARHECDSRQLRPLDRKRGKPLVRSARGRGRVGGRRRGPHGLADSGDLTRLGSLHARTGRACFANRRAAQAEPTQRRARPPTSTTPLQRPQTTARNGWQILSSSTTRISCGEPIRSSSVYACLIRPVGDRAHPDAGASRWSAWRCFQRARPVALARPSPTTPGRETTP